MTTPTDLINQALVEAGQHRTIDDLYEGSTASIMALQIYSQTRDDLLRAKDWPFARRTGPLELLKGQNVPVAESWNEDQPIPPWQFEYAYPADCLELRGLRPDPIQYEGGEPLEPGPIRWAIASDFASIEATAPQKVILTDLEFALATYTVRLANLDQWEPLATSALVDELARIFRDAMTQPNAELTKVGLIEASQSLEEADQRRG